MLTIGYEAFKALVELGAHEMEHEARIQRTVRASERAHPGWFSRQGRSLCGGLGAWLVALGRKLQAVHRPQALTEQV
jgi:hypothetical protein